MRKYIILLVAALLVIPAMALPAAAQEAVVQELSGQVSADSPVALFEVPNLQSGQVLHLYVGSNDIDPYVLFCTEDCAEDIAFNDDIDLGAGNLNSALEVIVPAAGNYVIAVSDCCDNTASGSFTLLVGLDAPEVLEGTAAPVGSEFVFPVGEEAAEAAPVENREGVQELTGFVNGTEAEYIYYDFFDLREGQTLYLYAESNAIDTLLIFCDILCEEIFASNDDIDLEAGNTNSALEVVVPADGDYSVAVTDCCRSDVVGEFRLLISLTDPTVLTGEAVPTGANIAVAWEGNDVTVIEAPRIEPSDCSAIEPQERPTLSGEVLNRETQNFIIHYTLSGDDATTEDFVDEVEGVLESILLTQSSLGWPLPVADCGEGGDERFDLYMQDTLAEGILGYAVPGGLIGDNPNSDYPETWAAYGYLIIDNDFRGAGSPPNNVMRATVAHEFHHAIQFAYDINDALNWFYEATASWMETVNFPVEEDASPYAGDVLQTADLCVGASSDEYTTRIYAEWLLIDTIAENYGRDAVIRLWEFIADYEGMEAFYRFLEEMGDTPSDFMLSVGVRNILREYDLSERFETTQRLEGVLSGFGDFTPDQDGVQELGLDFYEVSLGGLQTFSADQSNLNMAFVGITGAEAQVFMLGQSGTVDTSPFEYGYLVVVNVDQHDDPEACSYTDYSINVSDGTGATPVTPLDGIFDASRFQPA